jgi:hypothetical protein
MASSSTIPWMAQASVFRNGQQIGFCRCQQNMTTRSPVFVGQAGRLDQHLEAQVQQVTGAKIAEYPDGVGCRLSWLSLVIF